MHITITAWLYNILYIYNFVYRIISIFFHNGKWMPIVSRYTEESITTGHFGVLQQLCCSITVSYINLHTCSLWGCHAFEMYLTCLTWGSRGDFLPFQLWGMGVSLCYIITSGQAWGQESKDNNAVSGKACRPYEIRRKSRVHWVHNNQPTVNAHLHPALALQLDWESKLQVGYQFWTDRPWLKRNHRQEGIPPSCGFGSWSDRLQHSRLLWNSIIRCVMTIYGAMNSMVTRELPYGS